MKDVWRSSCKSGRVLILSLVLFLFISLYTGIAAKAGSGDDTYTTANVISVNKNYIGSCSTAGDVNWYKFTLEKDGYISLYFTHDIINSSSQYWSSQVLNEDMEYLDSNQYLGYENDETGMNIGLAAGTYYVRIGCTKKTSEAYTLRVNFTASDYWEKEFNTYYTTATAISTDTTYYGHVRNSDDKDYYVLTIPADGTLSLDFIHEIVNTSKTWRVYLYDASQSVLGKLSSTGYESSGSTGQIQVTAGTYYVRITGSIFMADYKFIVNYTSSENGVSLSDCSISLAKTSFVYSGSSKRPSVTVKYGTSTLVNGTDYVVTYSNNKKVGTAVVTIKGSGNYSGTVKKTFEIVPKATSLSKLTAKSKGFIVKWSLQKKQTSGYQIQYSTKASFASSKTKSYKNTKKSVTITGLKKKTTYYVRIRTYKKVSGKKYYSAWSNVKEIKTK